MNIITQDLEVGGVSPHAVHTLIYDVVCLDGMRVMLELRANEASSCPAPLLGRPARLSHPQRIYSTQTLLRNRDQSSVASPKEVTASLASRQAGKNAGRLASEWTGLSKLERQLVSHASRTRQANPRARLNTERSGAELEINS